MSRKANTEMLVRTEDLIAAQAAVNRRGADAALADLEAREPVLMQYVLGQWHEVYKQLRRQPQVSSLCKQQRERMKHALVVSMAAHAAAHYRLWRGTAVGKRLVDLDPSLADPAPCEPLSGEHDANTGSA